MLSGWCKVYLHPLKRMCAVVSGNYVAELTAGYFGARSNHCSMIHRQQPESLCSSRVGAL